MTSNLLQDSRIRLVAWRDLTRLAWWEIVEELTLSLPWLVLSLWLAARALYLPAAGGVLRVLPDRPEAGAQRIPLYPRTAAVGIGRRDADVERRDARLDARGAV